MKNNNSRMNIFDNSLDDNTPDFDSGCEEVSKELDFGSDFSSSDIQDASVPDKKSGSPGKNTKKKPIHTGHRMRMYDRYELDGFDSFSEHEVLEMILYNGIPRVDTNETAHNLIEHFGSLKNVIEADSKDLVSCGLTKRAALIITQYRELQNYLRTHYEIDGVMTNSTIAGQYCCEHFGQDVVESLYLISLDSTKRIKAIRRISKGCESRTESYPVTVLRTAVMQRASGIILCHNHPGGDVTPSNSDIVSTNKIVKLLEGVDIPVIDHIICSGSKFTSLADRGLINN